MFFFQAAQDANTHKINYNSLCQFDGVFSPHIARNPGIYGLG